MVVASWLRGRVRPQLSPHPTPPPRPLPLDPMSIFRANFISWLFANLWWTIFKANVSPPPPPWKPPHRQPCLSFPLSHLLFSKCGIIHRYPIKNEEMDIFAFFVHQGCGFLGLLCVYMCHCFPFYCYCFRPHSKHQFKRSVNEKGVNLRYLCINLHPTSFLRT